MLIQAYANYSVQDQETWGILYERQVKAVQVHAYENFSSALRLLDFEGTRIPKFEHLNKRLAGLTGWGLYVVPGLVDNEYFFRQMLDRQFGATAWLAELELIFKPSLSPC